MKKGLIILIILFMGGVATQAFADYLGQKFRDMDLNRDERVTWPEYKDYIPHRYSMEVSYGVKLSHDCR